MTTVAKPAMTPTSRKIYGLSGEECLQACHAKIGPGDRVAKSGPGVETALCLVKVVYCVGDRDNKT